MQKCMVFRVIPVPILPIILLHRVNSTTRSLIFLVMFSRCEQKSQKDTLISFCWDLRSLKVMKSMLLLWLSCFTYEKMELAQVQIQFSLVRRVSLLPAPLKVSYSWKGQSQDQRLKGVMLYGQREQASFWLVCLLLPDCSLRILMALLIDSSNSFPFSPVLPSWVDSNRLFCCWHITSANLSGVLTFLPFFSSEWNTQSFLSFFPSSTFSTDSQVLTGLALCVFIITLQFSNQPSKCKNRSGKAPPHPTGFLDASQLLQHVLVLPHLCFFLLVGLLHYILFLFLQVFDAVVQLF